MGALVSRVQYERVLGHIAAARAEGARLVHGGRRPPHCDAQRGYFIEPTVFADVLPGMSIAREEIFGPVLGVLRWQDDEQMYEQVNALQYGLTCSIWTRDLVTAHRAAQRVAGGLCLGERGRQAFPRQPLRRLQAVGHGPRGMPG